MPLARARSERQIVDAVTAARTKNVSSQRIGELRACGNAVEPLSDTRSTASSVAVETTTVSDSTVDVASSSPGDAASTSTVALLPEEEGPGPLDSDLEREYAGLSTAGRACVPGPSPDAGIDSSVAAIRGEKLVEYLTGIDEIAVRQEDEGATIVFDHPNYGGVWGDRTGGWVVAVLDCSAVDADRIAHSQVGPSSSL